MQEFKVPVVIIGGGGCGLVASTMLSNLEIENVLVEAHQGTSHLPKASYLNQRTAEILDQHGIWHRIAAVGCPPAPPPPELMKNYRYVTSIGGDNPGDRLVLDELPCYGCNDKDPDYPTYRRDSAYFPCNLPQIHLEPILKEEAEKRNPGKVLFNHRMIAFQEQEDHVIVDVVNTGTGEKIKYVADYVIAADGGKTVAPSLRIPYAGQKHLTATISVHIKANLSEYWNDGTLMCWIVGLSGEDSTISGTDSLFGAEWSVALMSGPTWGKNSEDWVIHLGMGKRQPPMESLTKDNLKSIIRGTLKLPDLDMEILETSRWHPGGVCATQFQTTRIFLAGDAAHRHPPITGLGLNTGIGDVHNLSWKLAAVLKDLAPLSLLQTYETERRPVGIRVVDWAMFAFTNIRLLDGAIGLLPGGKAMLPINREIYKKIVSQTFDGEVRRAAFRHAVKSQRVETSAHDLELGSIYPTGALVPDGSEPPPVDPRGFLYIPTARPWHRLPHAWLLGRNRISTHHLLDDKGSWVFITDDSDAARQWLRLINNPKKACGFKIRAVSIGTRGDFVDAEEQWTKVAGLELSKGGAVLVRPDSYIAFRAKEYTAEQLSQLEEFLKFM